MKTVIFRKPPSVQELRKKSGEDDMSGTAAKPFTVMQVTSLVGRFPAEALRMPRTQLSQKPRLLRCPYGGRNSSRWTGMVHHRKPAESAYAVLPPRSLQCGRRLVAPTTRICCC